MVLKIHTRQMTVGGTDLGELRLGTWWLWGQGMSESRGRGGNSGRTGRFCVWSAPHCRLASVVLDSEVGCGAGAADRPPPNPLPLGPLSGFAFGDGGRLGQARSHADVISILPWSFAPP